MKSRAEVAEQTELGKLVPRDLRRICAKLCRKAGGELEQSQLLLGHASIQTTERYLGTEQALAHAVNDAIELELGEFHSLRRERRPFSRTLLRKLSSKQR